MKIKIEGWVMLYHQGQIRFSAVHDTESKETIFAKANRDTGYVFESDLSQPTVTDYYTERDEINDNISYGNQKYYGIKQELARALVDHYIAERKGPDWVKAVISTQRQFNISEEGIEHENYGKFSFFLYVDPMKE